MADSEHNFQKFEAHQEITQQVEIDGVVNSVHANFLRNHFTRLSTKINLARSLRFTQTFRLRLIKFPIKKT